MTTTTPPDQPPRAWRGTLRSTRVLLLVLLELVATATVASPRVLRRLPQAPARTAGTWPLLAWLYLLSASWPAYDDAAPLAANLALAQHAAGLAVVFAFLPRRWHHALAIALLAAIGVNAVQGILVGFGAVDAAAPEVRAFFLTWTCVAAAIGAQHAAHADRGRASARAPHGVGRRKDDGMP